MDGHVKGIKQEDIRIHPWIKLTLQKENRLFTDRILSRLVDWV